VVITADHGEAFGDHGECFNHGFALADETLRVPLIVRGPGISPGRTGRLTASTELAPTLLERLGIPAPDAMTGPSFAGALAGVESRGPSIVFAEATKPRPAPGPGWINAPLAKSARTATRRVGWDPVRERPTTWRSAEDPGEHRERWAEDGARPEVRALLLSLQAWAAGADPLPTEPIDDADTRRALEALGYLGP
jgi:arylsulfatase A-like enzyme